MLKLLMLISGWIEVLFGAWALVAPLSVIEMAGGKGGGVQTPTLALVSLLGAATLGLGVGALIGRNHLETQGGLAAAYGLGTYNIVGGVILVLFSAWGTEGAGLWPGAILHAVIGSLFVYAFLARR
ncbi:hypothetical protein AUC69_15240 [Methyloceanibacter superfactus]|jgi:hypothetical protein|uniref:Uncharacterized protein n=1 Tax=Methyloceanibacter superfactus TaxID=1774969 RepID=A0A1E3VT40_9HYPH|nr:hypothetical protein [Methyloceanibacter superfactus]ODR96126.1 hypothetical protein AUC69_15240 [Methyloceanibacter superfactus]